MVLGNSTNNSCFLFSCMSCIKIGDYIFKKNVLYKIYIEIHCFKKNIIHEVSKIHSNFWNVKIKKWKVRRKIFCENAIKKESIEINEIKQWLGRIAQPYLYGNNNFWSAQHSIIVAFVLSHACNLVMWLSHIKVSYPSGKLQCHHLIVITNVVLSLNISKLNSCLECW